eukprot:6808848-Pyramimonas_sp.AAC.1
MTRIRATVATMMGVVMTMLAIRTTTVLMMMITRFWMTMTIKSNGMIAMIMTAGSDGADAADNDDGDGDAAEFVMVV